MQQLADKESLEIPTIMSLSQLGAVSGGSLEAEKGAKKAPGVPFQKGERRVGRQKGTPNRVTQTIREAVEIAAQGCHPRGFAGWLIERAEGGIEDRKIFASVLSRVIPLQVQQKTEGAVRIELGWLNGRDVGKHLSQPLPIAAQVIDITHESAGDPVIKDQSDPAGGVPAGGQAAGQGEGQD
jgi:hypothetical protein